MFLKDSAIKQDSYKLVAHAILWPAFAFICGLLVWAVHYQLAQPQLFNALLYPKSMRALVDFELLDSNNEVFKKQDLSGKWSLLFFGYMHCPDVCPQSMRLLSQTVDKLEQAGLSAQVVFVSVDPERDSTDKIKEYVNYFDPRFIGVTAELNELSGFTRALGVQFSKTGGSAPSAPTGFYLVDHSAEVFVISPQAEKYAVFPPPLDPQLMAADLATLVDTFSKQG